MPETKENVKRWMNYKDINPVQLTQATGIDAKHVLNCVYGTDEWSINDILKISDLFNITIDDLIYKSPEELKDIKNAAHEIHTSDIKTAVRLQNYFTNKSIPVIVHAVFINSQHDCDYFIIKYTWDKILEPEKITKIVSRHKKYSDERENAQHNYIRYKRMEKIVI